MRDSDAVLGGDAEVPPEPYSMYGERGLQDDNDAMRRISRSALKNTLLESVF